MKIKAFNSHKSFPELEEAGIWAPVAEDVEFKIRRMRSESVSKARDRIYGPTERVMGSKKIPDKLETELTCRLMSEALIVDWRGKGMVDDHGVAIPFTKETCFEVLSDNDYGRDLRAMVIGVAMDGDQFVPTSPDVVVDEGNSSTISSGLPVTEATSTT
jgi:hypothetical protein